MGAKKRISDASTVYPQLQVWRPIESNNGYTLVNSTLLIHGERTGSRSTNVYKYIVNPPILVQRGDILGLHQSFNSSVVLLYQKYGGPTNIKLSTNSSIQSVVSSDLMSSCENHYPLVTAQVGKCLYAILL